MRLIDADSLITRLVPLWNFHDDLDFANKDVWREIGNAPTVDAISVVRCKNCKHRDAKDGFCKGREWLMQLVSDDGFCDKGERSEE